MGIFMTYEVKTAGESLFNNTKTNKQNILSSIHFNENKQEISANDYIFLHTLCIKGHM